MVSMLNGLQTVEQILQKYPLRTSPIVLVWALLGISGQEAIWLTGWFPTDNNFLWGLTSGYLRGKTRVRNIITSNLYSRTPWCINKFALSYQNINAKMYKKCMYDCLRELICCDIMSYTIYWKSRRNYCRKYNFVCLYMAEHQNSNFIRMCFFN